MAAPLFPNQFDAAEVARRPIGPGPSVPHDSQGRRPQLRLIEGGRSEAAIQRRRMYRRRRIVVAAVALCTVVSLAQSVRSLTTDDQATSTVETGAATTAITAEVPSVGGGAPGSGSSAPQAYVVRRGDTLWSIAASLGGDGDVRELVDALSARVDGGALQPGQRIDLGGLPGLDD